MNVSFNWLKQYVDLPDSVSAEELGLKLTMSTVEVEGIKKLDESLEGIVVGKIIKLEKHPDADKLQLCIVDDGTEAKQVVCGGSNLKEGMKIAFAPIGVKVRWHGQGELVEIKKVKIRGVESNGMICQSTEIGLGDMFPISDEAEIIDLDSLDSKVGTPLAKALNLNDVVFDIDNKSMTHRPDLWGQYGMAREVSALYNKDLKGYTFPDVYPVKSSEAGISTKSKLFNRVKSGKDIKLKVDVQDEILCPRYMAVAVDGIKIEPSPDWLQTRLIAVGLRPINNIVDITNYVMYDLGQPMHAFDLSKLVTSNSKLVNLEVRRAEEGEKFKTLDGKEHKLTESNLVIADNTKAIALAGVMGGEDSEISENTKTIIFESANFDPANVRRTANQLGMRTDSSSRFEKSLDPNNCELALGKAVELTLQLCPEAKVASNIVDKSNFNLRTGPIELDWEWLWKKMGIELAKKQVIKILTSLGFELKETKQGLLVKVPTWRATKDISIAEDLVEEISRIYGYDNIERNLPSFPIIPPEVNNLRNLESQTLNILVNNLGYNESYNYSFVSAKQINNIGDELDLYIELDNPISKEKPYLRRNLLLNLLENVNKNIEFFDEVKLVEIGKVFIAEKPGERTDKNGDELLPRQDVYLTAIYTNKKDQDPFWQSRQVIEMLSSSLNLDIQIDPTSHVNKWQHPNRSGVITVDKNDLGVVYELHPLVAQQFGLEVKVGVVEINLNQLLDVVTTGGLKYQKISEYPAIIRDIAFVVKDTITHKDILNTLRNINSLLKKVELFDVYEGKNIGEGYKSMAYRLTYGSNERTLKTEEVDEVQKKITKVLEDKVEAEVRK